MNTQPQNPGAASGHDDIIIPLLADNLSLRELVLLEEPQVVPMLLLQHLQCGAGKHAHGGF